jgi:histidinol-phosphatase
MAALDVIVREAGGRFTSLAGRDGPFGGNALASNGMLHEVALGFLGAVDHDPEEPVEPAPRTPAAPPTTDPVGAVLDLASRRRPATWDPRSGEPDPSPGVPPLG